MLLFVFILGVCLVLLAAIVVERRAEARLDQQQPRLLVVTVNDDPQEFYA